MSLYIVEVSTDMSEWVGKLGSLHQYQNVPYVETTRHRRGARRIKCNLCGTGWMQLNQRDALFHGNSHFVNYNQVKNLERQEQMIHSLNRMVLLEPRVRQLGFEKWRVHVKSAMYDFTSSAGPDDLYDNVVAILLKHERMEAASLLELILWKYAACNGDLFTSLEEIREYPVLDEAFDVKAYLGDARTCSGSESIIPRVLAFL